MIAIFEENKKFMLQQKEPTMLQVNHKRRENEVNIQSVFILKLELYFVELFHLDPADFNILFTKERNL